MTMPDGANAAYNYPASSLTVTFDAPHGVYVMAYAPWPGFVDRGEVRVARQPWGPWSPPVELYLPGCSNTVNTAFLACYAFTAQPQLSSPSTLGIGYYDQAYAGDRSRGQYMVTSVPFVTVLS
jgi:hypothetical protein